MYASAQSLDLLAGTKNNLFPVRKPKVSASGVSGWKLIAPTGKSVLPILCHKSHNAFVVCRLMHFRLQKYDKKSSFRRIVFLNISAYR
jgi:hypothetical protein